MAQIRNTRRFCPRRVASASGISSPVYSAIFFLLGKRNVAKQPLPLIGDFLIARPGANLSCIEEYGNNRESTGPIIFANITTMILRGMYAILLSDMFGKSAERVRRTLVKAW